MVSGPDRQASGAVHQHRFRPLVPGPDQYRPRWGRTTTPASRPPSGIPAVVHGMCEDYRAGLRVDRAHVLKPPGPLAGRSGVRCFCSSRQTTTSTSTATPRRSGGHGRRPARQPPEAHWKYYPGQEAPTSLPGCSWSSSGIPFLIGPPTLVTRRVRLHWLSSAQGADRSDLGIRQQELSGIGDRSLPVRGPAWSARGLSSSLLLRGTAGGGAPAVQTADGFDAADGGKCGKAHGGGSGADCRAGRARDADCGSLAVPALHITDGTAGAALAIMAVAARAAGHPIEGGRNQDQLTDRGGPTDGHRYCRRLPAWPIA